MDLGCKVESPGHMDDVCIFTAMGLDGMVMKRMVTCVRGHY